MNNEKIVLKWLKETDIPLSKIAKKTGISRKSLYNWQQGHAPSANSFKKLNMYYQSVLRVGNQSIELTDDGKLDAQYIVELQQKQIEMLETQNAKDSLTDSVWDGTPFDFCTEVQLGWSPKALRGLERTVLSVSSMDRLSQILGWSEKELSNYWRINQTFGMNEHPVNSLITKESHLVIKDLVTNFLSVFQRLTGAKGGQYIPVTLHYLHKDGHSVTATVFNKIIWRKMLVFSKIKFITE